MDLPAHDRPRERLLSVGPRSLSLQELLAALIGTGGRDAPAPVLADRLLARAGGSLRHLGGLDPAALTDLAGVGQATACRILAALEIGRRAAAERFPERRRIRGPKDVHQFFGPLLRDLHQEEFHALLLDGRHCVLRAFLVTRGVLDSSLVHPREVFRTAIVERAAALILVHNHPSGDPTPSPEDRRVTRQLVEAGKTVGIPVLDHVIVGDGRWASVAEEGTAGP